MRTSGPFKSTKCSSGSLRLHYDERIDRCKQRSCGDGGWMQHTSGGWCTTRGKVDKKRVISFSAYMRCHSICVPKSRVDDLGQGSSRLDYLRAIQPSWLIYRVQLSTCTMPILPLQNSSHHCAKTHSHDKLAQLQQQIE